MEEALGIDPNWSRFFSQDNIAKRNRVTDERPAVSPDTHFGLCMALYRIGDTSSLD
jgi:hypothetical protein